MSSRNKQEQLQVDDDWGQDLPDISQVDLDDDHEALAMDHTLMNPDISSDRSLRLTTYLVIEGGLPPWDTIFQVFILILIFSNVTIFILSTVESIRVNSTNILVAFECVTIISFMIEYGLRLWCIVEKAKYGKMGPFLGRLAHVFTFGSIIDLVSIVPFWVDLILTIRANNNMRFYDVRVFSSLRILRIFRLFKADKYTASLEVIVAVFKSKARVLAITGVMGMILFLFTSTALYFSQGPVDPELSSIPASFYTAALLLTGQGYWNPAPVTPAGKWVVAISNVFSVAVFAIPAGILASGLEPIGEAVHERRKKRRDRRNRAIRAARERIRQTRNLDASEEGLLEGFERDIATQYERYNSDGDYESDLHLQDRSGGGGIDDRDDFEEPRRSGRIQSPSASMRFSESAPRSTTGSTHAAFARATRRQGDNSDATATRDERDSL